MTNRRPRSGFTLVELLVVTGLLASLMAMVIGGFRSSDDRSKVRRAAQDLASRLTATQSRALRTPQGAALIIVPSVDSPRMGTVILDGISHPWIVANVDSGMPPADPRSTNAAVTVDADADTLATAYKIRFQGSAGSGRISPACSPWFAFSSGTTKFRTSAGQTLANTIWPKTEDAAKECVLARYPTPGPSSGEILKQAAIDLRHSGVGETPDAPHGYGRFEDKGSIAVAYGQIGRVDEVMRRVQESRTDADQPMEASGVIYFLVVPRSDILTSRNTLANPAAVWVAINPHTGRVSVSENLPQATEDKAAVSAARQNARAGVAMK